MKKEYDFPKGERGKFYRPGARLNVPEYVEPNVQARLTKAAQKRHENVQSLVKPPVEAADRNGRNVGVIRRALSHPLDKE